MYVSKKNRKPVQPSRYTPPGNPHNSNEMYRAFMGLLPRFPTQRMGQCFVNLFLTQDTHSDLFNADDNTAGGLIWNHLTIMTDVEKDDFWKVIEKNV